MNYLLFAFLFALAASHVCTLQPLQRGTSNNLNQKGTADCFLIHGKCGGRPAQEPNVVLRSGSNFTVVFQKNQNHWTPAQPGSFTITYEHLGHTGSFKVLKKIPDTDTPDLTIMEETVTLPDVEFKNVVIGIQYAAPSANLVFYQCSDVELRRF